jgi:hypothetical protein
MQSDLRFIRRSAEFLKVTEISHLKNGLRGIEPVKCVDPTNKLRLCCWTAFAFRNCGICVASKLRHGNYLDDGWNHQGNTLSKAQNGNIERHCHCSDLEAAQACLILCAEPNNDSESGRWHT